MTLTDDGDGTYTLRLTEEELDALRVPLGRVTGVHDGWVRRTCSTLYFRAGEVLGYRDDVQAARGYVECMDRPKQPTTDRR